MRYLQKTRNSPSMRSYSLRTIYSFLSSSIHKWHLMESKVKFIFILIFKLIIEGLRFSRKFVDISVRFGESRELRLSALQTVKNSAPILLYFE